MKKSMNTDKFKERYFILERQHFCFYKPEKSNLISVNSFRGQELQHDYSFKVRDQNVHLRWVDKKSTLAQTATLSDEEKSLHNPDHERNAQLHFGGKNRIRLSRMVHRDLRADRDYQKKWIYQEHDESYPRQGKRHRNQRLQAGLKLYEAYFSHASRSAGSAPWIHQWCTTHRTPHWHHQIYVAYWAKGAGSTGGRESHQYLQLTTLAPKLKAFI